MSEQPQNECETHKVKEKEYFPSESAKGVKRKNVEEDRASWRRKEKMQVVRKLAKHKQVEIKLSSKDKSYDVKREKCTQLNWSKTPERILQMVNHIN